jgi:hypothetical protein
MMLGYLAFWLITGSLLGLGGSTSSRSKKSSSSFFGFFCYFGFFAACFAEVSSKSNSSSQLGAISCSCDYYLEKILNNHSNRGLCNRNIKSRDNQLVDKAIIKLNFCMYWSQIWCILNIRVKYKDEIYHIRWELTVNKWIDNRNSTNLEQFFSMFLVQKLEFSSIEEGNLWQYSLEETTSFFAQAITNQLFLEISVIWFKKSHWLQVYLWDYT